MSNCQKIIHPLKKGAKDYTCTRKHYKDGWCHQHHPEIIAAREKEKQDQDERCKEFKLNQINMYKNSLTKNSLTIENAIYLLINNGYMVGKLPGFKTPITLSELLPLEIDGNARTLNCLVSQEITTIDQLVQLTENDLIRTPNLGRRSLDSIVVALKTIGLKLKE